MIVVAPAMPTSRNTHGRTSSSLRPDRMIDLGSTRSLGSDGSAACVIVGWSLDNDVEVSDETTVVVVDVEVTLDVVVVLAASTVTVPTMPGTMWQ